MKNYVRNADDLVSLMAQLRNKTLFMVLHVGAPNPVNKEAFFKYLSSVLDSNWITNFGELNQNLEKKIEKLLEVKHCITVCNATTGLQLLYRALGLKGEVIIPSFTFVATAHS